MRLDKFLWAVRYYKTRSLAAEAVKKNRVLLNGAPVKSAKEVMVGDALVVKKNQISYHFKVIQIPDSRMAAKLVSLYIKDKTPSEEYEKQAAKQLEQKYYRDKGLGRPTKRDRRDLDDYLTTED